MMTHWYNVRFFHRIAHALLVVSLLFFLTVSTIWIGKHHIFDVRIVHVQGDSSLLSSNNISQDFLQEIKGNLLNVDLYRLQKVLLQIPWMKAVSIRRIWPYQLLVQFKAYHAVAIWGQEGQFLNENAEVFVADFKTIKPNLPFLEGPPGTEKQVFYQYQIFSQWFSELGVFPEIVKLSSRYAWTLFLSNGTVVKLGRQDRNNALYKRAMLMIKVWPVIYRTWGNNIDSVDLRHDNRLAISSTMMKLSDEDHFPYN